MQETDDQIVMVSYEKDEIGTYRKMVMDEYEEHERDEI
jgi:hypothetical protein